AIVLRARFVERRHRLRVRAETRLRAPAEDARRGAPWHRAVRLVRDAEDLTRADRVARELRSAAGEEVAIATELGRLGALPHVPGGAPFERGAFARARARPARELREGQEASEEGDANHP